MAFSLENASHSSLLWMPHDTAALRSPWPRLAGIVPGLTVEMEDEFRFGHSVVKVGNTLRMGGSIKGGSSSIWVTVEENALEAYKGWFDREGLSKAEDAEAFTALKRTLGDAGVELTCEGGEYEPSHGGAYAILRDISACLPEEHLEDIALERVHVGGWGPDAAKASAYKNGTAYIYEFAVAGAARTLRGLFLHELGHAFFSSLSAEQMEILAACHEMLAAQRSFMGVEYLLDAESRIVYQEFITEEFVAETYLLYTACGGALREFIRSQKDVTRDVWWRAYSVFLEGFRGTGYF